MARRSIRGAALFLTIAWSMLSTSPAFAAEPTPAEIAAARQLFAEARSAEDAEEWATAASRIRQAISIKETPGLLFHLAYCEEHLGMLVEALVDYERAEEAARSKNDDVEKQVGPRKAALRKRTPTITVMPASDVSDASMTIDGHAVAATLVGQPIVQNPGQHHVVVSAPGRTPYAADLTLAEADSVVVTVSLPVVQPAGGSASLAPGTDDSVIRPSSGQRWSARTYVLASEAAVTIAALGVGIGFMLSASAAENRSDEYRSTLRASAPGSPDQCWGPGSHPPECADLEQSVAKSKDHRFVSTLGFVGAGIGAAAFAATWLFWKSPQSRHAMGPIVTGEMAGVYVMGGF
jgi:hypothetical protein